MTLPAIRTRWKPRRRRLSRSSSIGCTAVLSSTILVAWVTAYVIFFCNIGGSKHATLSKVSDHRRFIATSPRAREMAESGGMTRLQNWEQLALARSNLRFYSGQDASQHSSFSGLRDGLDTNNKRFFLIYRPPLEAAQGIGNQMNGLLAAHLLGQEFNRIVCVSPEWGEFHRVFRSLDSRCPLSGGMVAAAGGRGATSRLLPGPARRKHTAMLWLLNFGKLPVNECDLRDRLAGDEPVLEMVGNTYPRWPQFQTLSPLAGSNNTAIHQYPDRLEQFYEPRQEFLQRLPWSSSRSTQAEETTRNPSHDSPPLVVHLREADDEQVDHRVGMDDATLQALGEYLQNISGVNKSNWTDPMPYLVTNRLDLYAYFEKEFGWSHPPWVGTIQHSAIASIRWGKSKNLGTKTKEVKQDIDTREKAKKVANQAFRGKSEQQFWQVWADWWSIYLASTVYHTHSDFSASAALWNRNQQSFTIGGLNASTGHLILIGKEDSSYKNDNRANFIHTTTIQEPPPLSERTAESLINCHLRPSGLDGSAYVMDLDDAIHDDFLDDWHGQHQN